MLFLEKSQYAVRGSREEESKLESDISTILSTTQLADGASEPHLGHSEDGTHHTEAEG